MNVDKPKKYNILNIVLLILMIILVVVAFYNLMNNTSRVTELETKIIQHENIISQLWIANYNNTVINTNQEAFHSDLNDWATNMTKQVNNMEKFVGKK